MGSGHLPFRKDTSYAKELTDMCERLGVIVDEMVEICASQDQPDNAFYDGMTVERISMAAEMLKGCIQ